jgi:hypothetical protein
MSTSIAISSVEFIPLPPAAPQIRRRVKESKAADRSQALAESDSAELEFVTFDRSRKHLARVVAVNSKKVTIRRFDKKSGEWRIKNESRDREACIRLTAAEAEESFPGSVAAWDKAAQFAAGNGDKVSRQMSPNSAAPAFQSVADFVAAYADKKKSIDALTAVFVDKMGEAKKAQNNLIPHFALMQSLLSKHGANHHLVIEARKQGHKIPWWTDYYESYQDRLWESLRTMERRIARFRDDPTDEQEPKPERDPIPRLDKIASKTFIEACLRANGLIAALEAGRDGETEIASFKAVMNPQRLHEIIQAQEHESDFLDYPDPPVAAGLKVWNNWLWGYHGSVQTRVEIAEALLRLRKNGFPYYNLTKKEKLEEVRELLRHGPAPIADGVVTQTMHALGLCWSYFPHSWEVRCNGMLTPMEVFLDDDKLLEVLENSALYGSVHSLTDSEVRKGLGSVTGAQRVSGFRPSAAWALYDLFCPDEGGTIFDPSGGWGGRMVGAFACEKIRRYIACEPASKTFKGLENLRDDLKRLRPDGKLVVDLQQIGSEDFKPAPGTVDCVLWSPPYFEGDGVVEEYSAEKTQSHVKFRTREAWLSGYLATTLANVYAALRPEGKLIMNVSDAMKADAAVLAADKGFAHEREMRYGMSAIIGAKHKGPKTEPLLIFEKRSER